MSWYVRLWTRVRLRARNNAYGGPYCIYRWYSSDGGAINYGVTYPNTADRLGQENQFRKSPTCPEDGVFAGKTYCDTIVR